MSRYNTFTFTILDILLTISNIPYSMLSFEQLNLRVDEKQYDLEDKRDLN